MAFQHIHQLLLIPDKWKLMIFFSPGFVILGLLSGLKVLVEFLLFHYVKRTADENQTKFSKKQHKHTYECKRQSDVKSVSCVEQVFIG